jgi:quinol monooxygenase YgiN
MVIGDYGMVMTILEARVSEENWNALKQAYQEGIQHNDVGLVQTFLVQAAKDPEQWRILSSWSSQAALDAMRSSGETPRGVLIFRSAKAEPVLSVFQIVLQRAPEWIG